MVHQPGIVGLTVTGSGLAEGGIRFKLIGIPFAITDGS